MFTVTVADWETAYRDNLAWIYRFAFGRVGNRHDAEDITAEVFARALPRLKLGVPPEQLRAYLALTARTVLADFWRRHYAPDLELPEDLGAPSAPVDPGGADRNVARAKRVLALLPDHYRRVLEFRFLRGYSVRETARALGVSVGNAKVLQYRALRRAAELGARELR
jgi:RNA polymerase sigma factor (sigma-70 family)